MISNFSGWCRSRTYDFWVGLKPSRVGLLTVLVLAALLFETTTEQGRDVLLEYALADISDDYRRYGLFYGTTFFLAVLVWITCWIASAFRFEREREILCQYRLLFPRTPFARGTKKAKVDANQRVANIYALREWAPFVLGILVPIIFALGFVTVAGEEGIDNALICLAVALAVTVMLLPFLPKVRELSSKTAQWASDKSLRRLAQASESVEQIAEKVGKKGDVRQPATDWKHLRERLGRTVLCVVGVLAVAAVASVLIAAAAPLWFGEFFGPFPVVMLALTVMLFLGTAIVMLTRVSNFPYFFLLVLVALSLSLGDVHDMRFLKNTERAVHARETASELFSKFASNQEHSPSKKPIIFVATAGGGSRAAYWTATMLGELSEIPGFNEKLFVISGVSGGSVGALFYRAALTASAGEGNHTKQIAKEAASEDFLSPTLASMFTRDLIPGLPLSDRAQALERAWAESFDRACRRVRGEPCPVNLEGGFLELWKSGRRWPALILNGTVVESGGRAAASSLKLDCAKGSHCYTADIADILKCEERDLVASSAANVGARFPIIGPSARAKIDCGERDFDPESAAKVSVQFAIAASVLSRPLSFPLLDTGLTVWRVSRDAWETAQNVETVRTQNFETVRNIVDGGYFDNFGAITLTQILAGLELEEAFEKREFVPIVIQISSDPEFQYPSDGWRTRPHSGMSESSGHQLFKPMRTMQNLRGALGRQAFLNLEIQAKRMGGMFLHLSQCIVPGDKTISAPLGWMLSKSSRKLLDSYALGRCGNADPIERLKACLRSPESGCDGQGPGERNVEPSSITHGSG